MFLVTTSENEVNRFCSTHGSDESEREKTVWKMWLQMTDTVRTEHEECGERLGGVVRTDIRGCSPY
jgi:hypothetical protein